MHLVGHGWYERWAIYVDQDVRVEIHRFLCKGCGKTISMLPDFLHRYRHYVLAVIEAVLRGRLEQGLPWSGLAVAAAPSQRSMRRWLGAFVTQALGWQAVLLSALARVQPLAGVLDPHGRESSAALAVLLLGAVFVAWLDPGCTAGAVLRVLWRWGWNGSVGRLV
jgi:hypothetical protein